MKLPIPAAISRQIRKISFKSPASMLRHFNSLMIAWVNSDKRRHARRVNERRLKQLAGLQRRHSAHAESCRQGYLAKINLVEAGKGHNTLAGIPA